MMRPARDDFVSIRDHRGRSCEPMADLASPPSMFPFRRPEIPLDTRTRKLLRIAIIAWSASLGQMLLLAALAMVAYTGLSSRGFGVLWVPVLVGILLAMLASSLPRRMARAHWANAGRHASAHLLAARGQCPSCASWLLSVPAGSDGLRACPTCAAAWRVGNTGDCPGCGYDMSRVPATAGPLAICPECATLSAANRNRIGSV